MRFLLFSDLQMHPYAAYSSLDSEGHNNRLRDHRNVLWQIKNYAVNNKIETIIFAGDFFESRTKLDAVAVAWALEYKHEVANAGIHQLDICGNHDLYDRSSSRSTLEIFREVPNQKLIFSHQFIRLGRAWGALFIPYSYDIGTMREALRCEIPHDISHYLVIAHYGRSTTDVGFGRVIEDLGHNTEGQYSPQELEPLESDKRCAGMFFGHYHVPRVISEKMQFIGTPLQHNWGEAIITPRFLDIEIGEDGLKVTAVRTQAPYFIEFSNLGEIGFNATNNFCRFYATTVEEKEYALKKFAEFNARYADVLVVPPPKPEVTTRYNLNLNMSFEEMALAMLIKDQIDLDKARLEQVMREALNEATRARL